MDEIKFRLYQKLAKEMMSWERAKGLYKLDVLDDNEESNIFSSWMQYTGLKDVNGTEIYVGDIVRIFVENDPEEKEYISKVYKLDGAFAVDMAGYDISTDVHCIGWIPEDYSLQVIGNIHSNPELLKNLTK
ncbi:YopX family protein [Bacillus cereus]|uniref:YopX protein domain-containing protein n=1 Tax=Bacillus cereus TIAC219 TaxID=718222 RepID=A0ABC9SQ45_BACCE|nr:YopX family protein [Bacillus cereus]EJP81404.1 hypothetical protein IC1_06338 [Bacillus cereus VD022]EOQ57613.1 hypothetical protein IAY_06398 [Bacillus cereus TIAC219]